MQTALLVSHVVQELLAQGQQVVCLVRDIARGDGLRKLGALLCLGSLDDLPSIEQEVAQADYVLHIAESLNPINSPSFMRLTLKRRCNSLLLARWLHNHQL